MALDHAGLLARHRGALRHQYPLFGRVFRSGICLEFGVLVAGRGDCGREFGAVLCGEGGQEDGEAAELSEG